MRGVVCDERKIERFIALRIFIRNGEVVGDARLQIGEVDVAVRLDRARRWQPGDRNGWAGREVDLIGRAIPHREPREATVGRLIRERERKRNARGHALKRGDVRGDAGRRRIRRRHHHAVRRNIRGRLGIGGADRDEAALPFFRTRRRRHVDVPTRCSRGRGW